MTTTTNAKLATSNEEVPFIVLQSPPYDADFASRWLAAAVEADRILAHLRKTNPEFAKAIENVGVVNYAEFSWTAMEVLRIGLNNNNPAVSLNLFESELYEAFAYMAGIGLLSTIGQAYRMTLPTTITPETVADAMLRLAATEDEDYPTHPEWLLETMTESEARHTVLTLEPCERCLPIPTDQIASGLVSAAKRK